MNALEPAKTGPRPKERNPPEAELKQVQKEKRTLERRLKRAELLLEIPKKASELTRSSTFQNHLRHGIRPGIRSTRSTIGRGGRNVSYHVDCAGGRWRRRRRA